MAQSDATGAAAAVNDGAAIEVSEAVTVRFLPPHSWFQSTSANGCQSPRSTAPRQPSWLTSELRVWSPNDSAVTPLVPVSVKPFRRTCCSTTPATGPVVTWPNVKSPPPRSASASPCPSVSALFWSVKMPSGTCRAMWSCSMP